MTSGTRIHKYIIECNSLAQSIVVFDIIITLPSFETYSPSSHGSMRDIHSSAFPVDYTPQPCESIPHISYTDLFTFCQQLSFLDVVIVQLCRDSLRNSLRVNYLQRLTVVVQFLVSWIRHNENLCALFFLFAVQPSNGLTSKSFSSHLRIFVVFSPAIWCGKMLNTTFPVLKCTVVFREIPLL